MKNKEKIKREICLSYSFIIDIRYRISNISDNLDNIVLIKLLSKSPFND